jgi:hypothetical protein
VVEIGLSVVAMEDEGLRGEAVPEGGHARAHFPFGGFAASRFLSVAAIDCGAFFRGRRHRNE